MHKNAFLLNIRVGKDLNIKVADFGLAKDVYMTDYYRHQSIEKMPVKWMAPEALHDRISNEKTEVVSLYSNYPAIPTYNTYIHILLL